MVSCFEHVTHLHCSCRTAVHRGVLGWADGTIEEFDPVYLAIILRSFKLAGRTVLLTLPVCYPAAFWVARQPERMRDFCLILITLPFFTSLIVRL